MENSSIVNCLLEYQGFLDNKKELDNQEFRNKAQNLNVVMTTATQSNGLCECNNAILEDMMTKNG